MFVIFIGVAVFLPDIKVYFETLKNGKPEIPVTPNNPINKDEQEENKEEENTYYDYAEGLVITYDLFS